MGTSLAHIELTASIVRSKKINVHFRIKKNSNEIFDKLFEDKETIESEMGFELEWSKDENKSISKIGKTYDINVGFKPNWEEAIKWQLTMAEKLYNVFSDRIKKF